MKNKALFKDFARYVFLSILGQIALSCYTLADTFFVSAKLGANGLTALNLAFPIFCILNGTGLMIGMAAGRNIPSIAAVKKAAKPTVFSQTQFILPRSLPVSLLPRAHSFQNIS